METILKFGSPVLLIHGALAWTFLLLPALGALLGARLCQGSFLRILGGAVGGASRDIGILLLVTLGFLQPNNSLWSPDISLVLAFFGASAAAIMSCLAPYKGKLLWFNAAVGGFAGQFLLSYVMNGTSDSSPFSWELALLEWMT